MVSQEQERALAGQAKPSLVPCYVLTLKPRTGKIPGEGGWERGARGASPGLQAARGSVGRASLGASVYAGVSGEAGPPVSADHVCCCQSLAKAWPAQAVLAGTVCLANLMSPELNAWRILT